MNKDMDERAAAVERALHLLRGYEYDACDVLDVAEYLRSGQRGLPLVRSYETVVEEPRPDAATLAAIQRAAAEPTGKFPGVVQ